MLDPIYIILAASVTYAFFSLVLVVVSLFLFQKAKKTIQESRKVLNLEEQVREEVTRRVNLQAEERMGEMIKVYEEAFEALIRRHFKALEISASKQISALSSFMGQQEGLVTKQGELMIATIIEDAKRQINEYKDSQFKLIDQEVPQIVEAVSRQILNKAIDLSDHEQLVIDALEKAKNEGIFNQGEATVDHDLGPAESVVSGRRSPKVK